MDTDQGKLFVGGISWETTEEKLKDYFQAFGEVIEAVIMKDRTTGRARGFGFVVFADPSVADVVVLDKHSIDGRMVEAKKAVPREEQQSVHRNNNSNGAGLSPSLARTKKIFVGGLASTVTESDFRNYFEQFGAITDVVVMYDHGTQRPRGFGFITFDSEDAVDRVLQKTFHELNEKMVEVKRAIPKDLSASPVRNMGVSLGPSPHRGSPYGAGYTQAFNSSSGSPYGFRMDARYGSPLSSRGNYSPSYGSMGYVGSGNYSSIANGTYGAGVYGIGGLYSAPSYGGGASGGNGGGYESVESGFSGSMASGAYGSLAGRSVWGSSGASYGGASNSAGFNGSGWPSQSLYSGAGAWGSSQASGNSSSSAYGNYRYGYGGGDGSIVSSVNPSHTGQSSGYGNTVGAFGVSRTGSGLGSNSYFENLYGSPGYGDPTWRATPADTLKAVKTGSGGLGSAVYGLNSNSSGNAEDLPSSNEVYGVSGRQSFKGANMDVEIGL